MKVDNDSSNCNFKMEEPFIIDHPSYYTSSNIETIDVIQNTLGDIGLKHFCIGNAIKYISRAGKKVESNLTPFACEIQDLKKAIWYLDKAIQTLEKINKSDE